MEANVEVEVQTEGLANLMRQSMFLGEGCRYVQGAGGNLSFKSENRLIIKASGTRLKDATARKIFLELDLLKSREAVLWNEDLSALVVDDGTSGELKPSIETAIHSLLPHRYVTHVHSIGAISRAIDAAAIATCAELNDLAETIWVPYARPGIPLAKAILHEVARKPIAPTEPLIVILGNHGVIVAGPDSDGVQDLLVRLESRFAPNLAQTLSWPSERKDWNLLAPAGSLDERTSSLLAGGVLTPDQAVFLGRKPFHFAVDGLDGLSSAVRIHDDGSVWGAATLSQDAWDIAGSFVQIANATSPSCTPSYLSVDDVDTLLNWDAEKWRKAQER